jgi:glutathione S-transferase
MNPSNRRRRLWGIGTARTLRPHWMLAELGLEYETEEIITRSDAMAGCPTSMVNRRWP